MRGAIAQELRAIAFSRARGCCEYCGMPQVASLFAHEVDHIIAVQHGGKSEIDNLAVACFHCNRQKGPNIATIDPASGEITRLFHPRGDLWSVHFSLQKPEIVGKTPVGRGTAALLGFNLPRRLQARMAVIRAGLWDSA
jgi:hypothetical protein